MIKFRNLTLAPYAGRKCIGFFGAIGSSLIGGIGSLLSQGSANRSNERMARENMEFQAEQNQIDREFQVEQWNRNNEYNTPAAQVERLQAAGLNPAMMYGQGGAGSTGNSDLLNSTHSVSPQMPTINPLPFENFINAAGVVSSSLKNLADAKKTGIETQAFEDSLSDRLRSLKAQADNDEAQARHTQLLNDWQKIVNDKKLPAEVKKITQDYYAAIADTDLAKAEKLLKEAQAKYQDEMSEQQRIRN